MKKTTIIFIFVIAYFGVSSSLFAQCPQITCLSNITASTDSFSCDAIVNFTDPIGTDPCSSVTTTFSYTGSEQTWIVPAGVTSISVDAYGAQGGTNWVNNDNFGGRVQADIPVTPGTTIYIYVGEQPTTITGGWNGGGNGEGVGIGGGGASDIRIGGNTLADRALVAGGAGGAGYWSNEHIIGGAGGGLVGANGSRTSYASAPGGDGGTQTSSGNGTCVSLNNPAMAGGFGFGGAPSSCGCEGYGGGSGWYGGAGSGNCRGGGGGSSYTIPTATNVNHTQGVRVGNGEISITHSQQVTTNLVSGLPGGSVFPIGVTTNTYEVTSGTDTAYCSFDIIVNDVYAPEMIQPANVSTCGTGAVNNIELLYSDNCGGTTVTYSISGATTGGGMSDASGTIFNVGASDVTYVATDSSGNMDSVTFTVTVYDLPAVSIDPFPFDSLCTYSDPVTLPNATPSSGIYSGNGVSGIYFDPSQSGIGTHWIHYTYTDTNGCVNMDSTSVFVDACAGLKENYLVHHVNLYPNPTQGNISVELNEIVSQLTYEMYSAEGKLISAGAETGIQQFQLNLNTEEVGVYFLKLTIEGENQVLRVVKQ